MAERYEDMDGVRWSHLKEMIRSPRHYLHARDNDRDPTPAMQLGTAVHVLALEPESTDDLIAVHTKTKDRKTKTYKEWAAEHEGKLLLLEKEYEQAVAIAQHVKWHPIAGDLVSRGVREEPLQWADPETGVVCKAKVDVAGDCLVDLKTTSGITPDELLKTIARFSYHGQLAHYLAGCDSEGWDLPETPMLVFVETSEPYEVVVAEVHEDVIAQGRRLRDELLGRLAALQPLPEDQWPGVVDDILTIDSLPRWAA